MKKESKLYEKSSRMPEARELKWEQIVPNYLESVKSQSSESAKSQRFLLFLNELFGVQPGFIEDYVSGVEKYIKVKQKDGILKGRVDELFGNLIIEFERDLTKMRTEAEEQLRKYVACLWSQETPLAASCQWHTPYLCIATDGINFAIYSPKIEDITEAEIQPFTAFEGKPGEIQLELVELVDLSTIKAQEVYFWLERYFLRKEPLSPKTENIVKDFGVKSHAFQVVSQTLLSLWKSLKSKSEFIVYESWEKYLRIVYGTSVAEEELFIRHTYLATLAKLMAWSRLAEAESSLNNAQILSVLEGQFFKDRGIENFLEEDFFSWIARKEAPPHSPPATGVEIARQLLSILRNYNLRELSEDVLKSLYQELVDPKTRHDLGEYYTPDWLAHRMVQNLLDGKPDGSLLDPACGSGTFLYLAVREKRDCLGDSVDTLKHILSSVAGVDIHPLAVIVAKTNYILALGDLIKKRKGKISIPIYLSDTIRLPERWAPTTDADYEVLVDGKPIYLPETLLDSPALYDEAIDAAREYAAQNAGKQIAQGEFFNFLKAHYPALAENNVIVQTLFGIAKTLKAFIEVGRDTIWAFVLKNIYKPLFLKGKFDIVIGNPPWLSYRYVEQLDYQKFLKKQITETYGLLSGRGELITHLELGTLFFVRTADLYLKEGGTIAFVLPRSVFTADQHDALRQGKFKGVRLAFRESWDLEEVKPLFNVPSCVLFAQKERDAKVSYPIAGQKLSGELQRRNTALDEAEQGLTVENVQWRLNKVGERSFWSTEEGTIQSKASYYKKYFRVGASIFPRSFWFVQVRTSPLGFDPSLPPLESSERAKKEAKDAYQGLIMKGNVESEFLYATLLSTDLVPFGHLDYRLIVLPIESSGKGYKLITADEARKKGFLNLAQWLEKAQEEWENRRGAKAERMDIYERLDRVHGLTSQNPQAKYRVFYNTSGTYLCACAVESRPIEFDIGGQSIQAKGFLADYKTYYFESRREDEAYYLAAMLNAPLIDGMIKPMQTRGQWGPRDICKKVLELSIPQFKTSDSRHLRLTELGKECSQKVADWVQSGGAGEIKSIGKLRAMVREMLGEELKEIDELVREFIGG